MQLKIKRSSLSAALTVINTLHKGARFDPPKVLSLSATALTSSTDNTSSKVPLNGTGEGTLTLLFKDLSNALPVLNTESIWLTFTQDGESIAITDDHGGKLLIYQLNDPVKDSELDKQVMRTEAFVAIATIAAAFDKASLIVSSDHPEYEALFFCVDGRIIATDTAKVLFMQLPNYRLYTTSMLKLPWRLAKALDCFYSLDKTNLPVTISSFHTDNALYLEAKISRDFWLITRTTEEPAVIIDKALEFKPSFETHLVFDREELAHNFEQLTKYLSKEDNPYVTVLLTESQMEVSATPRSAGALTKTIKVQRTEQKADTYWDGTIKFYLHPKHIINALQALDGDQVYLGFSDVPTEPIMFTPAMGSRDAQVLIAKMSL